MARDNKRTTYADYMARHLMAIAKERQAKIDAKLNDGYRPGFTGRGQVVLVKREETKR